MGKDERNGGSARDADFAADDGGADKPRVATAPSSDESRSTELPSERESLASNTAETARGGGASSSVELEKARGEASENHDKYLRALADFENYKKRALKERSDLIRYQGEKILIDLLEVVDNIERALQHAQAEPEKLRQGLELIQKLFVDTLAKWEVKAESGIGKEFDPSKYQALSKVKVDDAKPGTIITEFKKAYMYRDRLLRVGSVVVAADSGEPVAAAPDAAQSGSPGSDGVESKAEK